MKSDVIARLSDWAESHKGEQADFAKVLADEMASDNRRGALSLLDIRREFESRSGAAGFNWLRSVVVACYLIPIMYTWFELSNVTGKFLTYSEGLPDKTIVNLISFWSGGYNNAYGGRPLQTVAFLIFLFVFFLIAATIYVELNGDQDLTPELNTLIFDVQLELAKTRALTPQEFTKTISAAAASLEVALHTITSTVEEASSMIGNILTATNEISTATNELADASHAIGKVSVGLEKALEPIVSLESSLKSANDTILASTHALAQMRDSLSLATGKLSSVGEMTDRIGTTTVEVATATTRLMAQVNTAGNTLGATENRLGDAVNAASEIADRLSEVVRTTEIQEPHLVTMSRITQSLSETVSKIDRTVQEVKIAVETFSRVNSDLQDLERQE